MYELKQGDFHRVRPLLEGGHLHPEVISILESHNPGWIFVDQVNDPKSALVWSKGIEGFYLIGDHANEAFINQLDHFIKGKIEPRMKELSLNHFEISGHHDEWKLESIFHTRKLYEFEQLVYKLRDKPQAILRNEIRTINLKTEEWWNEGFQNTAFIQSHLELFWSSLDDFKKKGFGYAALHEQEIIGLCYSSFVTQDTHAIGIETVPHFQNKGVGKHLASLIVEEIYQQGLTAYWDCSLDNHPSRKLAERLGFHLTHRYRCIGFEL